MSLFITRILAMLERITRFLIENPITPALPDATTAQTEVTTITTALQAAAQNQVEGAGQSAGGVDLRAAQALDLRTSLKDVNITARVIELTHPGISPTFRLPASGSYPALIASAQAIIAAATELQEAFTAAGMPATFFTALTAKVAAFQVATSQKHDGNIARIAATAGLKVKAALGVIAAKKLDAYVRNSFRGNTELLAAWKFARHIERAPRRTAEPTTPPPDPGSSTGSGTGTQTAVTNG